MIHQLPALATFWTQPDLKHGTAPFDIDTDLKVDWPFSPCIVNARPRGMQPLSSSIQFTTQVQLSGTGVQRWFEILLLEENRPHLLRHAHFQVVTEKPQ